jgi:Uma2 family endonuclease
MTTIPLSREIEYPESDGRPIAESQPHGQVIFDLYHSLSRRYAEVPDVYVWFNMLLYFVQGDPSSCVVPDVFLVRGVDKHERRTYKVWEEGRAPSLICEVTSESTRDEDLVTKKSVYERLGVEEYFLFDPWGEYLEPRLQGYRLAGGRYQSLVHQEGALASQVAGIRLMPEGRRLRLRDAETDKPLSWMDEDAARREAAQRQVNEERRLREAAEQRNRALEEELARLRGGDRSR